MPCHHVQHAPNVGPILFARNENIAHVMPRVTARAVTSCAHRAARGRRQAGRPKYIRGAPEITYGRAVCARRTIYNKNNRLTF